MISRMVYIYLFPPCIHFLLITIFSSKWEIKWPDITEDMSSRGGRLSKMVVVMTTAQCIEEKYIRFLALRRREWIRVEDRRKGSRSKVQEQKLERGKVSKSGKKGKKRIPRCPPSTEGFGHFTLLFLSITFFKNHPPPSLPRHLSHHLSDHDFKSRSIIFRGD